jgi:hypothetical protein
MFIWCASPGATSWAGDLLIVLFVLNIRDHNQEIVYVANVEDAIHQCLSKFF